MVKIEKLLTKHEGLIDRLKTKIFDKDTLEIGKRAFSSKTPEEFKKIVSSIGVDKFIQLFDDHLINILKVQIGVIKEIQKTSESLMRQYEVVQNKDDLLKVIEQDPIFRYFLLDNQTLKKMELLKDPTLLEFRSLSQKSAKTKANFILNLYRDNLLTKPLYNVSIVEDTISKIKSGESLPAEKLFDIITMRDPACKRKVPFGDTYVANIIGKVLKGSLTVGLFLSMSAMATTYLGDPNYWNNHKKQFLAGSLNTLKDLTTSGQIWIQTITGVLKMIGPFRKILNLFGPVGPIW